MTVISGGETDPSTGAASSAPGAQPQGDASQPPEEAVAACSGLAVDSPCAFTTPQGTLSGTCQDIAAQLACVPADAQSPAEGLPASEPSTSDQPPATQPPAGGTGNGAPGNPPGGNPPPPPPGGQPPAGGQPQAGRPRPAGGPPPDAPPPGPNAS